MAAVRVQQASRQANCLLEHCIQAPLAPNREEVGIEHRPHNQFLHQALGIVLPCNVFPRYLHQSAGCC